MKKLANERDRDGKPRLRWALLLALVLTLAVVAAGCGGDDDDEEAGGDTTTEETEAAEGSIWVLLPDTASSDRWEKDDRRFFAEAFEEAGVEHNIVNAEGDANTYCHCAAVMTW